MDLEKKKRYFPFFLIFYEIVAYLSTDMYLPGLPTMANDFLINQKQAQYSLMFWFLGSGSIQLILGPISDNFGRKKILITGSLLYLLSTFACAITTDYTLFLIARFIQGSTVCSVAVAGYSTIHALYDGKRAIQILAMMSSVTILAPALGPFIGSILVEYSSWRMIFWLLTLFSLLCSLSLIVVMPETVHKIGRLELKQIVTNYGRIISNRFFLRYALTFALLVGGFFIWLVESPFLIIKTEGKSELYYGITQTIIFTGFILGAQFTRYIIKYWDVFRVMHLGLLFVSLAAIASLFFGFLDVDLPYLIGCMTLYGLGASMTFGPLNRKSIESCIEPMGKRTAVFSTMISMAGGVGSFIVSFVHTKTFDSFSVMISICVLLALANFFSVRENAG